MLRNLGLDLDLSKVGKDLKLQLALPNKTIKKNISDVTQANLEGFEINGLPKITFEIPHKIQERVGKTDEIRIVDNPDIKMIKEKMLIKATWYNKKRINWFRINSITQTDSQDFVTMRVEADALQSELRATNISTTTDPIDAVDYFTHVLSQTMWQLGTVSEKIKGTYRSFDDNKKTRYEAINNGLETFGAVADWDEENRVLNILSISDIREFRGVVLKKENYVSSLEIESNSEDIVTRLYVYGNEGKGIENVNPTGMPYIEDFSYFIYPFERDLAKNVITHSDYMSDELCHAILDLKLLQGEYNPRIKDLQTNLNNAYGDLSRNNLMLVELQGQLVTTQALLDTAKATNDSSLITQRESEVKTKETEIANKVEEINLIQASIDLWENTIVSYQELISTTSFTQALQNELSLFIYEKEFSDDRYIEEVELLEAGQEQFDKYQRPTRSFTIQLSSFVNSIESQHIGNRLQIGEEVLIKSTKLKTEYKSIVLGYNVDFKTGDYQLIISDNMDDIDSMDKLATLIYKADSSSTILNNNKYKWDNIVSMKDEVEAWRDKEIKTVENRIVAGANESVVIDNRGIQAHNPDFPDERIIIQSGVMALSRDGGKTWSTSVTPYGVMAETIIGRIVAGNNLVITNDSGSFVIDNNGLTVNMDDIRIMSGQSGTPEDMIQMWNNLLLTYDEIASDNLVNEYEKNQLEKQWVKIVNIHSSMVEQFLRGWKKLEDEGIPKPLEYNEYIQAYENLNTYLNTTKQSDGFALLDVANRTSTSSINPLTFSQKFKEYEMKKASFESVIAMEFTNSAISVLEEGISLTYTKNSEILTQLNLSEEGVRIDGKLLEINARTEFNADLVMNAGVIKDKDNGIIIDLNAGEITLNKPIRISAGSNVATKDEVVESQSDKITSSTAEFYLSTSNKILSGGSWQAIAPEWVDGKYMWQRTKLTYGNGTIKYSPSANGTCISGATGQPGSDGIAGKDGVGLRSTTIAYATSTNGTTAPTTGWSSSVPTLVKGQYLWTKTIWTYTDTTTETGYSVSYISKDGNDGSNGIAGKDGVGIKSTTISYAKDISGTIAPASGWTTSIPTVSPGQYLWTRTIWTYTDNTVETGYSTARMGVNGSDGISITQVSEYYQVNNSPTVAPADTPTWSTTPMNTSTTNRYLWNYEIYTYSNGSTQRTNKKVISVQGVDGNNGSNGISITKVENFYLVSTLNTGITTSTSGWVATPPLTTTTNKYLWNYEKITYSSGNPTLTTPCVIGVHGSTGDPGKDGVAGKDGKGVKSTTITYASSTSGTTAPTTNWSSAVPTVASGNFLWTRTIWVYTDDSSEIGYAVSYIATNGNDGSNGIAGKDGVGIKTTTITYASSTSGITTPTSGWTTTIPTVSAGNYLWTKTIWTYTDNTTETGYSVARMGVNGSTGATGNGISSIAKRYLVSSLNTGITTATSGWTTSMQVTTPTNKYLWSYEEVSYTDGTKVPTIPVIIGTHGENGQNSVTGILTNESITLPANKDGLISSFTGANGVFEIYDGITKKTGTGTAYSIVTQSNITVSINATTGAYSVTAMPTGTAILSGFATLRAIYNGVTIEKQLNVSKSVTGATGATGATGLKGADGIAGKDGKGISSTTITYGLSMTDTVEPTNYTSSVPTLVKGQYLWTKTVWTYTDTTTETGYTKTYIAKDGNNGTNGVAGKDGVGISATTITYAKSTNGTTAPTTGYTTTVPSTNPGDYLWTKTVWTYTDNTNETGYSVGKIGNTGATGATGSTGAPGVSSYTWIRYSPNANGSAMTTTPASNSLYIGVTTTTTNSAPTDYTVYTWALIKGSDGKGVKSTEITYQSGVSGTTTPTGTWTTTIPSVTKGQYLWTRVITTYTDNSTSTSYSASYQGVDGVTNVTGLLTNESITLPANVGGTVTSYTGATGTFDVLEGITKKTGTGVAYSVLSKTNIEVTIATTGVYTITSMTSGLTTLNGFAILRAIYNGVTIDKQINVAKAVTGATGATGSSGKDGVAGKDGKGINSTVITYATSASGTTQPTTGWTTTVPSLTKGQYLWTRTIWTYTDSTTETGYSVSYIAKDGNNGTDGIAGKDGVGISSTSITYTGSTSGTVTPTSGWVTTVPTVASESFLWTRTIWTYTDNTTETGYSVARMGSNGANGATGAPGASATSYWITASNNIIGKSQTGVINPTTITFKGFSKTGTANSVAYSGRFIIQTSTNGTAYTTRYTSSADQNTYTYTIPADTLFVKCLFYMAGGTTVLLDEQTVPIVESAEGIQVGGRNLLKNSDREVSAIGGREFVQFADLAPIFDEHGINEVYSLSVDLKSSDISKRSIIQVYMQNGSGTKYSFVHAYVSVTKEYQRFKFEGLKPSLFNTGETKAMLAFYGTYDTGNFPIIRRVKLEKGNKATDWQPAPEDARTYKAWANSSDGGEDFTRVYPNRNIFPKENVARNESMTEWGLRISDSQIDVQEGTTYTSSVYYEDVTVHQVGVRMYWMDSSGSTISESPTGNYIQVGQSGYSEITSVAPVGAVSMQVGLRYATAQTTSGTATWKNMKVEEYSSRTIYTTNPELSLSGSVPKYVGFSPIDSDVSHEYEWIMNPEYAQALADEALARKVDNDTEYENLKNIAEEVSDSFNNFVGEGGEYKTEHSKLLERTTAIETDLGEYRQQINFVDTYMSAGNEGLIMGVKDSEGNPDANAMQMLLSNKSLSFMDGGEVVAYFSGQSFHINRGAIVDSLQIGQHKISNLGNGHTVFQFIG